MKVTRETVAERAGVSKQTISYYYNKTRPIAPATVKRIEATIEELGYIPNIVARTLSNSKSNTVGIICNRLANPHYSEIISGVADEADKYGYCIITTDAGHRGEKIVDNFISRRVDGVILLAYPDRVGLKNIEKLKSYGITTVITHSGGSVFEGSNQLEPNFGEAISDAVKLLYDRGHKNIAMLSAYQEGFIKDTRLGSFCDAHLRYFKEKPIIVTNDNDDTSIANGQELARKLLATHPEVTAVFATNDLMCFGAMEVFRSAGIDVPSDMSVIGVDNLEFGRFVSPPLTTIGYDKVEYGKELFRLFLSGQAGEPPALHSIKTFLIQRGSVASPKAKK